MNKKILCMIALSALTLASCSKDQSIEQPKQNAIAFNVLSNPVTRAEATTTGSIGQFKVTAFDDTKDINFFENQVVGDDGVMTKKYYWPSEGTLKFFAYAPVDATDATTTNSNVTASINKNGQTITDFTPKVLVDQQQDLIVAYNEGTAAQEGTCLPLNFRHALSQIVIQAKNISDDIKVEVIGVKICHVKNKGTLTMPASVTTKNAGTLQSDNWDLSTETDDVQKGYSITGKKALELDDHPKNIMFDKGGMMLLPQQLTAWGGNAAVDGTYISVLCRISDATGKYVYYPKDGDKFAYSAVPVDTNWEPGKKYVYTLIFGQIDENNGKTGGGQVDPENTDPNNSSNPKVATGDITDKNAGDEILGAPICFTVTVDDWVEGTPAPELPM